jgi:hypothetical protein
MIYLDSTTTVALNGLKNVSTGAYINNATVAVVVKDLDGNTLIGPLTLSSTDSTGDYSGEITPAMTAPLNPTQDYLVEVTASVSSSVIDYRQETHSAQYRGFCE